MLRWSIGRQPLEWTDRVLDTVNLAEEIKTMLKRDLRRDGQPRSPEAQQRLVANLEAMVEAWAPELQAKFVGNANEVGKIEGVCELLGIEMTEERRQQLDTLDKDGLQALLASIKRDRAWPRS